MRARRYWRTGAVKAQAPRPFKLDQAGSGSRHLFDRLPAVLAVVAASTLACAQPSENAQSRTPTASNPAVGGLAALYPGDVGIESHPDVLFVERFEEAALPALFAEWTDVRNGASMAFSADVPPGSPGVQSLTIPWIGGGVSTGGHLYKQLSPGVDDTLYVRYYIKYPTSGTYSHHGLWMGGYNPPLAWPNPEAGVKPSGNDRFSAAAERKPVTGRFDHYDYWMDMHRSRDGNFWGNLLLDDPAVQVATGRWTCVEQMVKLNDPVGASNGEHAIWLDGVKVSHLGPGFPRGRWSGGIFTQDPAGDPFPGFRWRSDAALNLNWLWLQVYAPGELLGVTGQFMFDHLVAARSYIGCLPAATRAGLSVTRKPAVPVWPNEPAGLEPFNDQPWDRLAQPDPTGYVGRALERLRGLFSGPRPPGEVWGYLRRTSSKDARIIVDASAPFSPPNVVQIVYTPDMLPDSEPSVHWIALPWVKEVYIGWWIKLSPNWIPNPAGAGKITFLLPEDAAGLVYTGFYHQGGDELVGWRSGPPYRIGANTVWAPYGQKIWLPNVATTFVNPGEWHRVEFYYRWETTPGVSRDGIIRWWVDDQLNGDYSDVHYPPASRSGFKEFQFAPTVQFAGPVERYMYIDHTYLSTRSDEDTSAPAGRGPVASVRK